MTDEEILRWLKKNNPIDSEVAFHELRGRVKRAKLREIYKRFRNWRAVQPYEYSLAHVEYGGKPPIVITWDLEVSPFLSWGFEAYKGNVLKIEQDPKIIAISFAIGEEEVQGYTLADYPNYKPDKYHIDDKEIVEHLHSILSIADILIGQNSKDFDWRTAQARFWHHDLPPLSKKIHIDTLKTARREFRLPKNTLNEQLRYKDLGSKTKLTYSDLIWDCLDGDKEAWANMKEYNVNDVRVTRDLYKSQRGYNSTHPNFSFFTRKERECPACQSQDLKEIDQILMVRGGMRKEYQCNACGRVWGGEILKDGYDKIKTY